MHEGYDLEQTSRHTKFQKSKFYDGSTDTYDHLDDFMSVTDGKNATEADICKMFPKRLKGSAMN